MNVIETRLAGKEASLIHITRFINRNIGTHQITRAEVRYSTQSATPLAPQTAKESIAKLLREHGMGQAAISVRPHEGPIDDATGEHVLRLHHAQQPEHSGHDPIYRPSILSRWLARLFPRWFQASTTPATAGSGTSAAAASTAKPPVTPKTPTLTNTQAVDWLRKAVTQAAGYLQTETSTALNDTSSAASQVQEAHVIVRLDYLNAALGPMLQGQANATHAAKSIGDMVRALELTVAPTFTVRYTYQPRVETIGTSYANETDVEVVLRLGAGQAGPTNVQANTQRVEPTLDGPCAADYTLGPDAPTAMPCISKPTITPTCALTVRVLGTLVAGKLQAFENAFVLNFAELPARFDRNALAQAGFGAAHPGLLAVASNSRPLLIQRGQDGVVRIHTTGQAATPAGSLPMYYQKDSLTPLVGEETLGTAPLQVVVNDPAGVVEAASGKTLPALVLELRCGVV